MTEAPSALSWTLLTGTQVRVVYCPPDWDVGRITRTIDLQAHAKAFRDAWGGVFDGDSWAHELWANGILEWVCDDLMPCEAYVTTGQHDHEVSCTINIYPQGARIGGPDAEY
jgi:hypothetical protein